MTSRVATCFAAAALAAVAACGDDNTIGQETGPLPDVVDTGNTVAELATAVIGPEGGVIETDFGVEVTVPPGAVDERVTFEIGLDPFTGLDLNAHGAVLEENVLVTVRGNAPADLDDVVVVYACIEPELGTCVEVDRLSPFDQGAVAPLATEAAPVPTHVGRSTRH